MEFVPTISIDRQAREELADLLVECLATFNDSGDARRIFRRTPRSPDPAVRVIRRQIVAALEQNPLSLPTRADSRDLPIPPDVFRLIDRAICFLHSDQPYRVSRGERAVGYLRWITPLFVFGLLAILVSSIFRSSLSVITHWWIFHLGFALTWPMLVVFVLSMLFSIPWCVMLIWRLIQVDVLGRDLSVYEESEEEFWPFPNRETWLRVRPDEGV
ncbi:MAG: hypothetical protein AAF911_00150 [Planctomycetota bacterium]